MGMFRFVALFALVAVAFAEPEADSQFVYSNVAGVPYHGVYNTYAEHVVAPMTKQGVPEDTDSVKLAKKQHELAQEVEKVAQKMGKVQYVAPYTTYAAAAFPYVHHPVAAHVIAKREADSEADPAVFYNAYNGVYPAYSAYSAYPYTTAVAGYPYNYNKVVAGVPYTTGYTYSTPVESVKPKLTVMPLFTITHTDTTTLHTLTTTAPHTPTTPSHTEMFTDGTEPLSRT